MDTSTFGVPRDESIGDDHRPRIDQDTPKGPPFPPPPPPPPPLPPEETEDKVRVLSVDKLVVERIVLESNGSREVLLTKNESTRRLFVKAEPAKRRSPWRRSTEDGRKEPGTKTSSKNSTRDDERERASRIKSSGRIKPIRITKNPLIGSLTPTWSKSGNAIGKRSKLSPKINERFIRAEKRAVSEKKDHLDLLPVEGSSILNKDSADDHSAKEENKSQSILEEDHGPRDDRSSLKDNVIAQDLLERSQSKIETLQQNLSTKIHASTARSYKEKLPGLRSPILTNAEVTSPSSPNRRTFDFDRDFLKKHNLDQRLKIEEKRLLETDLDYLSDTGGDFDNARQTSGKPAYSEKVREVEKRWSGEFLEAGLERNSSASSKSSYVEEFGSSVSSRESILLENREASKTLNERYRDEKERNLPTTLLEEVQGREGSNDVLENSTVSTVDSDSCLEDRIKAVDEDIENENKLPRKFDELEEGQPEYGSFVNDCELEKWNLDEPTCVENTRSLVGVARCLGDSRTGDVSRDSEAEEDQVVDTSREDLGDDENKSVQRALTRVQVSTRFADSRRRASPVKDGYASLIEEFTMDAGAFRAGKKEEKQKKKLGLRRLLPGLFSPKDSRKEYKKKEQKEQRKKLDEQRHFARYQQNGNYTRSPDTMNLNEDIKRNVKLDTSLNGSIIEERLDEIKRELFSDQGPPITTSTPDHFSNQNQDHELLRDRARVPRSYATDSSLSSIAPEERWSDRSFLKGSQEARKYEQQRLKEQQEQQQRVVRRYGPTQLERKYSLQESGHGSSGGGTRNFFQRNHGPSGRISAPPSERFLMRPRAVHPVDRPLPAIPRSRLELSENYENYDEEERTIVSQEVARCQDNNALYEKGHEEDYCARSALYENGHRATEDPSSLILTSVSAQVKITRHPIVIQNERAPLVGRSPKYPSPGSSQKSADYADSSCTPNSSQKSEFSPTSSKSGEYYLHSPRNSARTSPIVREEFEEDPEDRCEGIYENERNVARFVEEQRIYDQTPTSQGSRDRKPIEEDPEEIEQKIVPNRAEDSQSFSQVDTSPGGGTFEMDAPEEVKLVHRENRTQYRADKRVASPGGPPSPGSRLEVACARDVSSPGGKKSTPVGITGISRGPVASRRSQPNDQILIASPKRETERIYDKRIGRPSNESGLRDPESPVRIQGLSERIPGISPILGNSPNSLTRVADSPCGFPGSSCLAKDIRRPEPIYIHSNQISSHGEQIAPFARDLSSTYQSSGKEAVDERVAWVRGRVLSKSTEPRVAPGGSGSTEEYIDTERTRLSATQVIDNNVLCQQQHTQQESSRSRNSSGSWRVPETIYVEQRQRQPQDQQQRQQKIQDTRVKINDQPVVVCNQQQYSAVSPSKRQTMQHLEAFYWQQKALDAQRRPTASPSNGSLRFHGTKTDSPDVREAVYWQKLKKLDEEQQRRIYDQNPMESEGNYERSYYKMSTTNNNNATSTPLLKLPVPNESIERYANHSKSGEVRSQESTSYWNRKLPRGGSTQNSSGNPIGKPPLMQGQKVQNQLIQVVRPQQAIRDRQESAEGQRSKSTSPQFHGQINARKSESSSSISFPRQDPGIDQSVDADGGEPANDVEGKPPPPPIFKRGSLVSAGRDSVDYGTTGHKRVSFSNQTNQDVSSPAAGNWPTKHGPAPEPPTRRHRSEDSTSDTDSVFLHHQGRNECDLELARVSARKARVALDLEYDANRPLPPPPKDSSSSSWLPRRTGVVGASMRGPTVETCNLHRCNPEMVMMTRRTISPSSSYRGKKWSSVCESESGGSDAAGEVQHFFRRTCEEEWNPDGKGRQSNDTGGRGEIEPGSNEHTPGRRSGGGGVVGVGSTGGGGVLGVVGPGGVVGVGSIVGGVGTGGGRGTGGRSRDEPRRHTLGGGDHQTSLHHQQFNAGQQLHPLHPHHLPPPHGGQYGTPPSRHTTMDLEMGTKSRQRKSPLPRGYPPPSSTMLFDDDPGIMSEVETSSTGFRRGGKQRSSLPVVRTPSKTLERPLGLVFLQYRNETKRALLPNEITSIDTVKALFVRSFPKQLTMEYLDSPHVKVYIHDSNKDMFYELEDLRSHLRDIRDRSVLRLFESSDGVTGMPGPMGVPGGGGGLPPHWEDQSYFSEPEFDSEYQHQHIHKSKTAKNSTGTGGYYVGGSSTLPRGGPLLRAYSPAASSVVAGPNATPTQNKALTTPDRLHGESGYMSSPERGGGVGSGSGGRYPPGPYSAGSSYEDPYYSQYSGTVTPVIDEEARIRVEHMERQLANLTGLVQKALTHAPHTSPSPRDYLQVPATRDPYARAADDSYLRTDAKPPKLGKDKSVSFEKSVSFSDEPPDMNSPKQHSPQHAADTKPTKPAIKSSTLPRMSSQERDRHKPTPPPKPAALVAGQYVYRDLALTPEMYNQLRGLQKKAKDLRQEVRNLRRMSQAQAHTVRETIRDTFITIRAMLLSGGDAAWTAGDTEKIRLSREEDLYKQEMIRLENDLTELESTVEELRGNVINRKTRVNMSDVENMALILSKSSKTVADLKVRFPGLQEGMKGLLSSEMEKVVREEKFLKEEPERLESALRRCKKLTGTLVTLKRLASVQEQRLPNAASVDAEETPPITPTSAQQSKAAAPVPAERTVVGSASVLGGGSNPHEPSAAHQQRPENALDALLDELQTFSRPGSQLGHVTSGLAGSTATSVITSVGGGIQVQGAVTGGRAPSISDIGRKGSVDSSTGPLGLGTGTNMLGGPGSTPSTGGTLRRLHSYPSSSDTDTSPPIARLQVSLPEQPGLPVLPQGFLSGQKPPVPERNAELLQLASARRVPPPPPPRTSSRSPLASPTSPQLPPRNHPCSLQPGNATLRRPAVRCSLSKDGPAPGKPPMALPPDATAALGVENSAPVLSTSNSSSCESVNSQEGVQSKRGRQEQLEQRHQELLRKQKALQEQYARLQQLQRNAAGLTTVPPAPPDLLKKTGSESNLLAKMGLGLSAATSGSLTSLSIKPVANAVAITNASSQDATNSQPLAKIEAANDQVHSTTNNASSGPASSSSSSSSSASTNHQVSQVETGNTASTTTATATSASLSQPTSLVNNATPSAFANVTTGPGATITTATTTSKIYETDIL